MNSEQSRCLRVKGLYNFCWNLSTSWDWNYIHNMKKTKINQHALSHLLVPTVSKTKHFEHFIAVVGDKKLKVKSYRSLGRPWKIQGRARTEFILVQEIKPELTPNRRQSCSPLTPALRPLLTTLFTHSDAILIHSSTIILLPEPWGLIQDLSRVKASVQGAFPFASKPDAVTSAQRT